MKPENNICSTDTETQGEGIHLETERLLVRGVRKEDAAALLAIQNTEYVLRYNGMEKWDLSKMRGYIEKHADALLTVCFKDGTVIGQIGITEDSLRYDVGSKELNFYLSESAAGKGYMSEALNAVLEDLFLRLGVSLVTARAFVPNTASRRLLQKLGFRQEGELRRCVRGYGGTIFDDALYSITKEEFCKSHGRA